MWIHERVLANKGRAIGRTRHFSASTGRLLLCLCFLLTSGRARAVSPPTADYYYPQPGTRQQLWLDPHTLAFFPLAGDAHGRKFDAAYVHDAVPDATLAPQGGTAIIATDPRWTAQTVLDLAKRLWTDKGLPAYAVYRTSADGGNVLVLTGRVIVRFRPGHDRSKSSDWADKYGLRKLAQPLLPGSYVYASGPGYQSLIDANRLNGSADVEWAAPDWLRSNRPRVK